MTQLRYAPAREEDIPAIFAQAKAVIDAYEDVEHIPYDRVMDWMRRKIAGHLTEYRRIYRGESWRAITASPRRRGRWSWTTCTSSRRTGGRASEARCFGTAWPPRKSRYSLYVFTRNVRARALYERLGFRTVQEVGATRLILERAGGREAP